MTRDPRRLLPILAFSALAAFAGEPATPAGTGPAALGTAARPRMSPWVLERTSGGEQAEFIVVLKDQADLSAAAALADGLEKRRYVRDALYARARDSQGPLLEWLRAEGIPHRSFFIVNAVLVTGTRAVAEAVAARSDVTRIEGNLAIPGPAPVQPAPGELEATATRALAPQAIEPGVTSVRAPEVWAMGYTGQGIVIGGADTGVQWDHPALIGKYRGWNGSVVDHDYNWHDSVHRAGGPCGPDAFAPCDEVGHGTHTLGTAVGANAPGTYRIGVAPGARFIACRNMDQADGTLAMALECMEWFLAPYPVGGTPAQGDPARAPDVTIHSYGCSASEECWEGALRQAIEAHRAAGILFVASAGNAGPACASVHPPALFDAAYSVGAFDPGTGSIAGFSSRGPATEDGRSLVKPDIAAPGVGVLSAVPTNTYATHRGTSMAAPHVAGAVALLWSACPSLRNRISQTEDFLAQGAVPVSAGSCGGDGVPNDVYGWGRLDIKAAVDIALLSREAPATAAVWLGPALPNPAHRATRIRFRLEREGHVDLALYSSSGRRVRTLVRGERPAGEHVLRWDGLDERGVAAPAGVYLVMLEARGDVASRKLIWLGS